MVANFLCSRENMTPQHRLASYYGYAFESYCTLEEPQSQGTQLVGDGWGGSVDTNVQWCTVVKTKIDHLRILMGGEVDCVRGWSSFDRTVLLQMLSPG